MQPTYSDYSKIVTFIRGGTPVSFLRQDLVYELFRRGILSLNRDDKLELSELGLQVCERILKGQHAPELD